MGTWTLWIAFNSGVALLLLLDLGVFHRRAHTISLREAALQSVAWITVSVGFGSWIFFSHGRGPGLEFFTGYLIEQSLSMDNVFVFLLIFQYFRVDSRYQHRLLFWGVLGAFVMRGVMIGAGVILIQRFAWVLYLFGAFLLYAGLKLFRADQAVHPETNLMVRWVRKIFPLAQQDAGQKLFARENGRWLATPLFLVVIALETMDLVFATDSIPAVFGVTHDPFLVYSSNVCAILGLRSFYFLLAGTLPYFRYLNAGLAVVLMFIGAKMLAEPWLHLTTEVSLAIIGGVLGAAVVISLLAVKRHGGRARPLDDRRKAKSVRPPALRYIDGLANSDSRQRTHAAEQLFEEGAGRISGWIDQAQKDEEFRDLLIPEQSARPHGADLPSPRLTVGIAVFPIAFENIRAANGFPPLAHTSSDQDVLEFELEFEGDFVPSPRLDILTTKAPGGGGAIARYLEKFGEGIQQVELDVSNVDRATEILRTRFKLDPIYPATRSGANRTRVNFFLVNAWNGKKVLLELVEQPQNTS
jgi:tellurite resistance protein TerC